MTQGERIKKIRKALGLTQEKFGKQLGMKSNSISQLEKGVNNLTDQMARAICREYNVNYDYLIYGNGEMFNKLPETALDSLCLQYDLDDLDRVLVDVYISMPADIRQVVKSRIKEAILKDAGNNEPRRQA